MGNAKLTSLRGIFRNHSSQLLEAEVNHDLADVGSAGWDQPRLFPCALQEADGQVEIVFDRASDRLQVGGRLRQQQSQAAGCIRLGRVAAAIAD